jgi:signal recognition particle receptor subunit beta
MVFFNHATRQMTVKIVYYGPGLCGKTTNLNTIYGKTSQKARGEMVSLNTETDRTLFFDLLPMDVGMVGGFKTKLQLYTVPGQVFYNSTRKLVLKGVDGIVFVVDSQTPMLDACKESYQNIEENLRELGLNLVDIPLVFQWNKRDLRNVVPVEELEATFNSRGLPSFQSVASDGTGVFETLRGITKLALSHIKTHILDEGRAAAAVVPEPAPLAPPPAHAAPSARAAGEALTLSDLPSVTDLLGMGSSSQGAAQGTLPLPDEDDDSGYYIEAPMLPEPPEPPQAAAPPPAAPVPAPEPAAEAKKPVAAPAEIPVVAAAAALPKPSVPAAPAPTPVPPPAPKKEPAHLSIPAPHPAKAPVKADPFAALASLKIETHAPAPKPKPKPSDPKDAIHALLGELTLVGRPVTPSVLRLEAPAGMEGQEIEVVVQLRSKGQVLAESQLHRALPAKGSTAKLSIELKSS